MPLEKEIDQEKQKLSGWYDEQALLTMLQVYTQSTRKNASKEEHMEFRGMCICQ